MSKLKTIAAAGAAALLMTGAIAAPAAAQPWRYEQNHGGNLSTSYVDGLEWRINNAAREGRISWRQARGLVAELRSVQPLAWRVETGQASQREYRRLANTVDRIERMTSGYRYGYNRY